MTRACVALWLMLAGMAQAGETARDLTIPDWIELRIPAGFTATEGPDGLIIREDGALRTPLEIEIPRSRPRRALVSARSRETAAGRAIWDLTRSSTDGSGGEGWTLKIEVPIASIFARQQREGGPPDFAPVWEIVDSIRPAPRD